MCHALGYSVTAPPIRLETVVHSAIVKVMCFKNTADICVQYHVSTV